jgi:hypothetical protein
MTVNLGPTGINRAPQKPSFRHVTLSHGRISYSVPQVSRVPVAYLLVPVKSTEDLGCAVRRGVASKIWHAKSPVSPLSLSTVAS